MYRFRGSLGCNAYEACPFPVFPMCRRLHTAWLAAFDYFAQVSSPVLRDIARVKGASAEQNRSSWRPHGYATSSDMATY